MKKSTIGTTKAPRANPYHGWGGGYNVNCQAALVALELRARGELVEAMPNVGGVAAVLSFAPRLAFIDKATGRAPRPFELNAGRTVASHEQYKRLFSSIAARVKDGERWALSWGWKDTAHDGHIVMVAREDGELLLLDGQSGEMVEYGRWAKCYFRGRPIYGAEMFKLSGMVFNRAAFGRVVRPEGSRVDWRGPSSFAGQEKGAA